MTKAEREAKTVAWLQHLQEWRGPGAESGIVCVFRARTGLLNRLPTTDRHCAVSHAAARGVLPRSIVVEREPIYRETAHGFAPAMYGLGDEDLQHLSDDRLGRVLDRLYDADRAAFPLCGK